MAMTETIIVALISFAGTLCGAYFANRKSTALIAYRMEQLEKKVDKHNTVIERTYRLEENEKILDEKMKVANHRIDDLEGKK
jgi:hypothetical protein